ncbi:MAG: ABC transporter permease subunit [Oscillibacter sp.]|nr:ABC transporter permease subunit [Oscillibacter sp.]
MKKTVIGLKMEFLLPSLIASGAGAVCLFLPYASVGGSSVTILRVMGGSWLALAAFVFALATVVLGAVSFIRPNKLLPKIWAASAAFQAAFYTILMFASKSTLDGMGILPGSFLVKNFGIGYWLGLIMGYVTLILVMKLAKINTGYIALTILGVIWLFPVLWIVLTSLRAESGYYVGYFMPKKLTFDNFVNLFSNPSVLPFGKWWVNTMIVAVCGCVINTVIVLGTAFILSRTRFKGRKTFMNILMIIGMFPGFMSMLAVYNILKGLGLNQSIFALVIVGAASAAMGYHVCKGFFDTIPKALDEAAIIDGASRWTIFTQITIPLSKPIAIYTVLTNFLGAWSDYIFPSMLFGDNQANYTVAIGLKWMTDFRRIDTYYTQFAAGAVIVAVPIVILFICLQKYYVEGLSGAVKG